MCKAGRFCIYVFSLGGVGDRRCNAKFSEQGYVGLSGVEGRSGCAVRQNRRTEHGGTEKSALQGSETGVPMRRELRVGGVRACKGKRYNKLQNLDMLIKMFKIAGREPVNPDNA